MNAFTIFQSYIIQLPNVWTLSNKLRNYTALKTTSLDKWLNCQRWTMRQMWERLIDGMYWLPSQLYSVCLLTNRSDLHLIGWENLRRDVRFFNVALSSADIQHQKKISMIQCELRVSHRVSSIRQTTRWYISECYNAVMKIMVKEKAELTKIVGYKL